MAKKGSLQKYGEDTKVVPFRCPISKVEEFKDDGYRKLKTYEKEARDNKPENKK